jgi:short subunit dehydrogenase-like uncharacterized protein
MAGRPRVLIAGGYGVFGRLLARELLATTPAHLLLAGRDPRRAAAVGRTLTDPSRATPLALDLADPATLERAARGCAAVACAAGPFQGLPRALPAAALGAGAHWLDIADDPGWTLPLLADAPLGARAAAAGLAVVPGLSSVPALSGALVRWCHARQPTATHARVTLFIGNRNSKGAAAIASALDSGIVAPQRVVLPLGRYLAYRFASPDAALLRAELGLTAEFRVALEWSLASRLLAALAPAARRLAAHRRERLARLLAALSAPLSHLGSIRGCVQAELWGAGGRARAALVGTGQRLAILPCALATAALLDGSLAARGLVHPATWLAPDTWVERLQARGLRFTAQVT